MRLLKRKRKTTLRSVSRCTPPAVAVNSFRPSVLPRCMVGGRSLRPGKQVTMTDVVHSCTGRTVIAVVYCVQCCDGDRGRLLRTML